jgi:N utilization substance protein B
MHLLYEAEAKSQSPLEILRDLPVVPDAYALTLVEGVAAHQAEIDGLIAGHASGWELGRMPAVDRQLLRLATYELLAEPEVPAAVVIDEAVELAKQYSTEESGRYVNGVLAAIGRRLGRLAGPAAPGATAAGHLAEQAGPRPGAGGRAGGEGLPRPGTVGGVRAVPGR